MRSISPYEQFGRTRREQDASVVIHTFSAAETLTLIAEQYYGDWRMWKVIAAENDINDPRQILPGTQLVIPRRPLERGRFESL